MIFTFYILPLASEQRLLGISMLVTDVGESPMETQCVGDKSRDKHRESGTNIKYQAPTSYFCVL